MDDCSVGAGAGDGGEGQVKKPRLRGAESSELGGDLDLGQWGPLDCNGALEPREEVGEGGAVDEVRLRSVT